MYTVIDIGDFNGGRLTAINCHLGSFVPHPHQEGTDKTVCLFPPGPPCFPFVNLKGNLFEKRNEGEKPK
jgi:hypothetical protein